MSFYDLYGFRCLSLQQARSIIEKKLHVKFEKHESLYQGGEYYKYGQIGNENFLLKKNRDPFDNDEFVEPDHPEYNILLYINNTQRTLELQQILKISDLCKLLKSEDL